MSRPKIPGSISHKRKEVELTEWQKRKREADHIAFMKVAPRRWAERATGGRPHDPNQE